jgi:hypothetical protein
MTLVSPVFNAKSPFPPRLGIPGARLIAIITAGGEDCRRRLEDGDLRAGEIEAFKKSGKGGNI